MVNNSIGPEITEQCKRDYDARLAAQIAHEHALYEAEQRGEVVEWPPDNLTKYCPVCQVPVTAEGINDAWDKNREEYGALPEWMEECLAVACCPEHDHLWQRMQEYRGVLDYRRCYYCHRTFTGSVQAVSILTWPEPKSLLTKDHLEHWHRFYNAHDPLWAFRIDRGYGPGRYWSTHEPEHVWRTVDMCSEGCVDGYVSYAPEPLDYVLAHVLR
jgi:hypothetical protein